MKKPKTALQNRIRGTGMTQEEFADAVGICQSALQNYLYGHRSWPVPQMVKAAEILNLSAAEAMALFVPDMTKRQRRIILGETESTGGGAYGSKSTAQASTAGDADRPVQDARMGYSGDVPAGRAGGCGVRRFRLGGAVR